MDLGLTGKIVLVTGGAKGIGEAITRGFAAEGAIPVIFGRNQAEAESLSQSLRSQGLACHHRRVELTETEQVRQAINSVSQEFGRVDVVVNNAGCNDGVGLDCGPEAFEQSLRANLVQFYTMVHHALPFLRAARGSIVNIGSKVAVTGQGGTSAYAAAKGGVNSLTREWALDLAKDLIRVNAVIPAEVMTPLYEKILQARRDPEGTRKTIADRIPLGQRFTLASEIAQTVVFIASDASSHTTGQILYVDGGYTHLDRMYGLMSVE